MKWRGRQGSSNVEDRRGMGGKGLAVGGVGGLIIVLIVTLLGGNPGDLINNMGGGTENAVPYEETAKEKDDAQFVSVVLADTEKVWSDIFREKGMTYKEPTLVLYSGSVQSACGTAGSSVGPFYCPGDQKLYIDLSFYQELKDKFGAPGDFAMAYVIAHEVGHHVQTLLGTTDKVQSKRSTLSKSEYNKISVRTELQADYYAGVWANHEEEMDLLEKGDIEEALNAASGVGDDTLQKKSQGYAVPESFTHGTSAQRKRWFDKGFNTGTIEGGDTFKAKEL
ncbi:neutral zinc metallopeptidase [Bacillus sp. NEB1478]|uniref:KPN_02809 family neutral zinc metallopeptidase n=1 Tax=Bacillus sp. NEB1478 TaxID=3073816 RepID=UPI002872B988|nr:neutral zinc metallopeptidase [Bacillus sp. NEB1478]WNB91531.1 neutral zinc metallopeptidase [Bacillus sp. NEB1478]